MEGFFIPFIIVALAELFDKSQLAILLLASQTKKQKELFLGVFLAFAVLTGLSTIAGGFITSLIPELYLKIGSSIIFILFGAFTLLKKSEKEDKITQKRNIFLSGFTLIFLSELGDKTQLSTIVFAVRFSPLLVFFGALSALALLAFAAIKLGGLLHEKPKKELISKIAGVLFILMGIIFFFI